MNQTTKCLEKLSLEICDLTMNFTFFQNKIDHELVQVRKKIKDSKTDVKAIDDNVSNADEVTTKLIELEKIDLKAITF